MLAGRPASVFEDGRQLRDFVNVEDVARANRLVLERGEADFQVFNVGGGRGERVADFAQIVAETVGHGAIEVTGEYRVGDTRHSVSDITKLRRLGWEPRKTARDSVRDYVTWIGQQRLDRDYAGEALETLRRVGTLRKVT
jgi:dTDP-L-rhamnose 4-epimerase